MNNEKLIEKLLEGQTLTDHECIRLDNDIYFSIVDNNKTSNATLNAIAKLQNPRLHLGFWSRLTRHSNVSVKTLQLIINNSQVSDYTKCRMVLRDKVTAKLTFQIIEQLVEAPKVDVGMIACYTRHLAVINQLVFHNDDYVRCCIANNDHCPDYIAEILSNDVNGATRAEVSDKVK